MGHDGVQLLFFQERERLTLPRFAENAVPQLDFKNVDGVIGAIVGEGLATLRELKERYTLEDALDLYEIIAVRRTNEALAVQHAERNSRR